MRDIVDILHAKRVGGGWIARCPAHDDRKASLSIGHGDDGRWLIKCHAGCLLDNVLAAVNLTTRDLFPDAPSTLTSNRRRFGLLEHPGHVGSRLTPGNAGNAGETAAERATGSGVEGFSIMVGLTGQTVSLTV